MQSWQRRAAACWRLFQQTESSCTASAERCHRHAQYVCSPQPAFVSFVLLECSRLALKFPDGGGASVLSAILCFKTPLRCSVVSCCCCRRSPFHRQLLICAPPVTCLCLPSQRRPPHTGGALFMHQGKAPPLPSSPSLPQHMGCSRDVRGVGAVFISLIYVSIIFVLYVFGRIITAAMTTSVSMI